MILPKDMIREKCKLAPKANKPKGNLWWGYDHGNPIQMGAYALNNKRKKKR